MIPLSLNSIKVAAVAAVALILATAQNPPALTRGQADTLYQPIRANERADARLEVAPSTIKDWSTYGFTATGVKFYRSGSGAWTTDMDWSALLTANMSTWLGYSVVYLSPSGTEGNDGLSPLTPKRNIGTQFAAAGNQVILLDPDGLWTYQFGFQGAAPGGNKIIMPWGPPTTKGNRPVLTVQLASSFTWVADTTPGVWYTSVAASAGYSIDTGVLDSFGRPRRYQSTGFLRSNTGTTPDLSITTLALLRSNVGAGWYDSGNARWYVNTGSSSAPGSTHVVYRGTANCVQSNSNQVWMKGVELRGGSVPFTCSGTSATHGLFDVILRYSQSAAEGVYVNDGAGNIGYLQDVQILDGAGDGLDTKNGAKTIDENTLSLYNGYQQVIWGAGTYYVAATKKSQASTFHDSAGISVNSEYGYSGGPNIEDIKLSAAAGSQHLLLGCYTYNAQGSDRASNTQTTDVFVGGASADPSLVWLVDHRFATRKKVASTAIAYVGSMGGVATPTIYTDQYISLRDFSGSPAPTFAMPIR